MNTAYSVDLFKRWPVYDPQTFADMELPQLLSSLRAQQGRVSCCHLAWGMLWQDEVSPESVSDGAAFWEEHGEHTPGNACEELSLYLPTAIYKNHIHWTKRVWHWYCQMVGKNINKNLTNWYFNKTRFLQLHCTSEINRNVHFTIINK